MAGLLSQGRMVCCMARALLAPALTVVSTYYHPSTALAVCKTEVLARLSRPRPANFHNPKSSHTHTHTPITPPLSPPASVTGCHTPTRQALAGPGARPRSGAPQGGHMGARRSFPPVGHHWTQQWFYSLHMDTPEAEALLSYLDTHAHLTF